MTPDLNIAIVGAGLALLDARVRAGGAGTAGERAQALELCHRLDNLPLALELAAAARLRSMPIGEVLAGLSDRFALLDDALRGLPERHAGLWALVDWSRALLEPAEQDLLARLAVIPAPFTAAGGGVHRPRPGRGARRRRGRPGQPAGRAALGPGPPRRTGHGRHRHRPVPIVDGARPAPRGQRLGAHTAARRRPRRAAAVGDPARPGQRPPVAARRPARVAVRADRRQRREQRLPAAQRARPPGAANPSRGASGRRLAPDRGAGGGPTRAGPGRPRPEPGPDSPVDEWLRRSERHWELVGAAQDARSARVLLDTQLALAGDADAEHRLRTIAGSEQSDMLDAGQADLGLAELAWRRGQHDEALRQVDAVERAVTGVRSPDLTQPRIVLRVAVAVIRLWVADVQPAAGVDARAVGALRQSGADVLAAHDRELLGGWAMGGAELAAFRGDTATARELWALATRVGVNVSRFLPPGRGVRLATALGDRETREPLLAEAGRLSGTVVQRRISALMEVLLA